MVERKKGPENLGYIKSINKVAEALKSPALDFLIRHVPEFYASVARNDEISARNLVYNSFAVLSECAGQVNRPQGFAEGAKKIHEEFFQKEAPDFWFTGVHNTYKAEKARVLSLFLAKYFKGNRVLDIGGGSGYLAAELKRDGFSAEVTDVLDYRSDYAKEVPFKQMEKPLVFPYQASEFDSAVLFEVLHHVDNGNHLPLLYEAARVADRLVVVENVYGDTNYSAAILEYEDPVPTKDYLEMSKDDQLKTLILMDYYVNIAAKGIYDMNIPFTFKTFKEWLDLFKRGGFELKDVLRVGFWKNTLNRNFQLYFVLNKVR
ncbi:MAG: class I SAM-dependent methyltransferase [bacterium]|nr:class I SAM-dependent methyltransferase [bacterium]